jgi:glycosyltransferase involved in cell wall biosynthesis
MRQQEGSRGWEADISVAVITNSLPGTSGRVVARALVENLQKRCRASEVFVESQSKARGIAWHDVRPEKIVTHFSENFKYIQAHVRMPRYRLYQYVSHNYLELARWRRPAVAMIFDILPLQIEGLSSPGTVQKLKRRLKSLKYCSAIVAISQATRKALAEYCAIEEERIDLVYLGVNTAEFSPKDKNEVRTQLGFPPDRRVILSVGGETPNRNAERIIRAFKIVTEKLDDVILLRVGASSEQVNALISQLGLSHKVMRAGQIAGGIQDYYRAADIFLSLDLGSGFGLPNLEAMASGCPVLCSNTGAFPEVVGDAAVLADPLNIQDASAKLFELLENRGLQENLRVRGIARARNFTWEKTADSLFSIYRKVLTG